jgi:hypothetical protein
MKLPDVFIWEVLKIRNSKELIKFSVVGAVILFVFLLLFSMNFVKSYFHFVDKAEVKNVIEYFFTRISICVSMIFILMIIFTSFLIYESEFRNNTYIKIANSKISLQSFLNSKLFIHFVIVLIFISLCSIIIASYSSFMTLKFRESDLYSVKSNWISWLEFFSLLVIRSINCCLLIRSIVKIFKNHNLRYLVYGGLFLNNLIFFNINPFNFFHTSQTDFSSGLIYGIITTIILSALIIYEKRIFKN